MKSITTLLATALAGAGLLGMGYLSLSCAPSIGHPGSLLLVLPVLMGVPLMMTYLIGPALFWLWQPGLFRGSERVPRRSLILFLLASVLSILLIATGWHWGVQYQGLAFVRAVASVTIQLVNPNARSESRLLELLRRAYGQPYSGHEDPSTQVLAWEAGKEQIGFIKLTGPTVAVGAPATSVNYQPVGLGR